MDSEERLTRMRAELAALTARIEEVSAQTRGARALRESERESVTWTWLDSVAWILFVVGWC